MQRYFVPESSWRNDKILIKQDDAHHIARVMRMDTGDTIVCVDPGGHAALCKIETVAQQQVVCALVEWMEQTPELPVDITIVQGLAKGDKMEYVLQKGTEMGASGFIPFQAARSVVKWDQQKAHKKLNRYEKIVKESAEQSHRTRIPVIHNPMELQDIINVSGDYDVTMLAYEEEAKIKSRHAALSGIIQELEPGKKLLVVIGPEGGLTLEEANEMQKNGFLAVRTGPRILRTETAALYILAAVSYHLEELRCQS
ncbi:16S rRNA (uracil(1498)-N(3))-methyltransferase [Lentibacillus sp. JNUCC-1]|uniref:16S rRNA (uracil(1498)-N(3))-methyltransferase n=1 Tax=Lentibacillus sp. JNUCC-1 TaxID=2654513 RepID=UPI0012E8C4F5|nr:16S rRNA (uracil(1498)-N(3))-methyltransferase [Lentibacillus sp. JNUCC-1]MUV39589.1 16S rRNA (uracil(1498)-N(3))-methyltransferase [Lentibacillus sp. JNUCC-1]